MSTSASGRVRRLSTTEAAHELGVSAATVKRWADRGVLRAVRTAGGHRRFEEAELDRLRKGLLAEEDALSAWVKKLLDDPDRAIAAALRVERDRLGAWYRVADALQPVVDDLHLVREVALLGDVAAPGPGSADRLGKALARCTEALAPRSDAPRALLAAPEERAAALELSLVELCMRERGWNAIWTGGFGAERVAEEVERGAASAVTVTATATCAPELVRSELDVLVPACQRRGVALVVAGTASWPEPLPFGRVVRTFSGLHAWMSDFEGGAAPAA